MRWIGVAAAAMAGLGAASAGLGQSEPGAAPAAERAEAWREDVRYFASELPKRHRNLFFRLARERFEEEAAGLIERVGSLKDYEVVVGLMRLCALVGDAHTSVGMRGTGHELRSYPLAIDWFSDGWFVGAADVAHGELVGAKVEAIGGVAVAEVEVRAAGVVTFENEAGRRNQVGWALRTPEILAAVGVVEDMEHAAYTLRTAEGKELGVILRPAPWGGMVTRPDALPLHRQQRDRANWVEWLEKERVVYCRYDRCADQRGQTVAEYAEGVLKLVDEKQPRRVVVDLRNNGGGNSALLRPLVSGLADRRGKLEGGVAALIGRRTFSSGQLNAVELKRRAGAVLIGEPTGQKPNAYGEIKSFKLPRSGISVWYSTKYFRTDPEDRESTMPDVEVVMSSVDFFAGKDPVLEEAVK